MKYFKPSQVLLFLLDEGVLVINLIGLAKFGCMGSVQVLEVLHSECLGVPSFVEMEKLVLSLTAQLLLALLDLHVEQVALLRTYL